MKEEVLEIAASCMKRNHLMFLGLLIHWLTIVARGAGDLPVEERHRRYAEVNEAIHYYSGLLTTDVDEIEVPSILDAIAVHFEHGLIRLDDLRRIEPHCQ
jgi:hypothetical protein